MVKYVIVDEIRNEVVKPIIPPDDYDDGVYADYAIYLMKHDPIYDPKKHFIYLKVGGQENNED